MILALPFLGSLLAAFLPVTARNIAGLLAGTVALAGTVLTALFYSSVSGRVVRAEIEWLPSFGLNLLIRLDGLAWVFALLVLAIGFLVVLYAR